MFFLFRARSARLRFRLRFLLHAFLLKGPGQRHILALFGLETRARSRAFAEKHCSPYAVEHCSVPQAVEHHGTMATYGCFQKSWYPQIIHFNRVFHYKPSILGAQPYFWVDTHICNSHLGRRYMPFPKRCDPLEETLTDRGRIHRHPKVHLFRRPKNGKCLVLLLMAEIRLTS